MRALPLVQWLQRLDIPARVAYSGVVGYEAPSMEHRDYCHAPSVTYRVIAAADRWAVEFSDGGPQVCRELWACPQPEEIAPLFERSVKDGPYCVVLDPAKDEAQRFLPAPLPPRVASPPPPAAPTRVEKAWQNRRLSLDAALIRLAWLTIGILTGLTL